MDKNSNIIKSIGSDLEEALRDLIYHIVTLREEVDELKEWKKKSSL